MINLVVAYDRKRGIGKNNELPWGTEALPSDLRHFRALTLGHAVVMGRKTHESIRRALPGRRNIVVTRGDADLSADVERASSLEAALALAAPVDIDVIGGGEVFRQALPLADRIYATEVAADFDCDVTFPALSADDWRETAREPGNGPEDTYQFEFVTYERTAR